MVFGNRYLIAGKADLSSGGVLESLPRAATAELAPGNVVKLAMARSKQLLIPKLPRSTIRNNELIITYYRPSNNT